MDGSATNRYELLYMDDDASDPLEALVRKKVKQQKQKNAAGTSSTGGAGTGAGNQAIPGSHNLNAGKKAQNSGLSSGIGSAAEKENKSSAMNKNFDKKIGPVSSIGGQKQKSNNNNSSITAPTTGPSTKEQSNYRNNQDQRQPREGRNFDRNLKQNGETREQRNNRRNRDDRQQQSQQTTQQNGNLVVGEYQNNDRFQRRGGGGGGGGPRRNFEGGNRGKREFDRQSGSDKTGVKAVDKREGAGAHNWGSHKQDIEDINKTNDEASMDKDDSAGEQQTEQQPNIEEETKELTLDEWKAQRAVRAKPKYNIRKAGEGEDLSQWKKMVALNNKKRDEESEEELEYDPSMYPQRVGRLQRVLDIEFHFNDGRRVGGIGRGRGRARGQGGGAGRQGRAPRNPENVKNQEVGVERQRGGQHAPKVDDEHDFPSLG